MGKRVLLLFFLLVLSFCCRAQKLLSTEYTPTFKEGRIRSFLTDIKKRTGIAVSFSESLVNTKRRVRLHGNEHTIEAVLNSIFQGQALTLRESGDKILVIPSDPEAALAGLSNFTISGFIRDSSSKEVLIGASVYIPELSTGILSNNFGFYSLTIPSGKYHVLISYIGYKTEIIALSRSTAKQDIYLASNTQIDEVRITEKVSPVDHANFKTKDINFYTGMLGDNDVLKALQHLPGVQPGSDGTSNLIVRGGDPGQNLNLLDGVPLYYTDHFYGITSIYNTDALKNVDFYSGSFPARYGGRLSSITDVNTKDGDMEQIRGVAKIGLLNGSLSLEAPLIKNKSSAIVTARRSWMDLMWRPFDNTLGVDFYDVNAKVNYTINSNNRLYLSVYNGRDQFRITDEFTKMRARWGNSFIALKWNTVLSPKLFTNTSVTYSSFRYELKDVVFGHIPDSSGLEELYKGVSAINEKTFRSQFYWYLNVRHKLELGVKYANAEFSPATVTFAGGTAGPLSVANPAEEFQSNEAVLYAEDEWKISQQWKLRLGLHWANWFSNEFIYNSLQPRLFFSWLPQSNITLFTSVSRMAQFLHLLSNYTSGFPTDFWLPSTARIKPETSTLGNVGVNIKAKDGVTVGLELYYKQQENLITYRGGQNIFDNAAAWEGKLTQGKGWSYGTELMVKKESERFSARLAYTLSWSFRQYEHLNNGNPFPYRYDRRHNLHLDGIYHIRRGIEFCAGWTYMSGEAITLPDQVYPDFENNLLNNTVNYGYTYNYTSWNNFRLPAIHRLDLAVNFVKRKSNRYERTLTIGIYNAYGRRNIVGTSLVQEEDGSYKLEGISIARFIPTLSYRVQF